MLLHEKTSSLLCQATMKAILFPMRLMQIQRKKRDLHKLSITLDNVPEVLLWSWGTSECIKDNYKGESYWEGHELFIHHGWVAPRVYHPDSPFGLRPLPFAFMMEKLSIFKMIHHDFYYLQII
jgi:hypothetical protein